MPPIHGPLISTDTPSYFSLLQGNVTREGFGEHASLPIVLSPIFTTGKGQAHFWSSPEGRDIITTKILPKMEYIIALGFTVVRAPNQFLARHYHCFGIYIFNYFLL